MRIGILGLGLGGATAAAALARTGHEVVVFEQAGEISEVGAGVACWPNSVRLLRRLGLADQLESIGVERQQREVLNQFGHTIGAFTGESRDGTPTYFFHRAELLAAISGLVDPAIVQLGRRCVDVENAADGVGLEFSDGTTWVVDVLIAADGIRSTAQKTVVPASAPTYSNLAAYRGLIKADPSDPPVLQRGGVWTDRRNYFIAFPVSGGSRINFVGVAPMPGKPEESWFAKADRDELRSHFVGWDPVVQSVIDRVTHTFRWGLYHRPPLPRLVRRRVALLGDAAHPMLIQAGQGAGQAIEDAFAVATFLDGAETSNVDDRLRAYERLRLPRATQVQLATRRNAQFLHADFPLEPGEMRPDALFDAAWIADYDVELDARRLTAELSLDRTPPISAPAPSRPSAPDGLRRLPKPLHD